MLNKCPNLLQVVKRKLFDVVVASTIDIVRRVLVFALLVHLFSVVEGHNFVSATVDYVDRTVDVGDAVDVRKLVER